jgi:hypothetical protein
MPSARSKSGLPLVRIVGKMNTQILPIGLYLKMKVNKGVVSICFQFQVPWL